MGGFTSATKGLRNIAKAVERAGLAPRRSEYTRRHGRLATVILQRLRDARPDDMSTLERMALADAYRGEYVRIERLLGELPKGFQKISSL